MTRFLQLAARANAIKSIEEGRNGGQIEGIWSANYAFEREKHKLSNTKRKHCIMFCVSRALDDAARQSRVIKIPFLLSLSRKWHNLQFGVSPLALESNEGGGKNCNFDTAPRLDDDSLQRIERENSRLRISDEAIEAAQRQAGVDETHSRCPWSSFMPIDLNSCRTWHPQAENVENLNAISSKDEMLRKLTLLQCSCRRRGNWVTGASEGSSQIKFPSLVGLSSGWTRMAKVRVAKAGGIPKATTKAEFADAFEEIFPGADAAAVKSNEKVSTCFVALNAAYRQAICAGRFFSSCFEITWWTCWEANFSLRVLIRRHVWIKDDGSTAQKGVKNRALASSFSSTITKSRAS